jgi:hypothetical protein
MGRRQSAGSGADAGPARARTGPLRRPVPATRPRPGRQPGRSGRPRWPRFCEHRLCRQEFQPGQFQPGGRLQEQPESGWLESGQAQQPGRTGRTHRAARGRERHRRPRERKHGPGSLRRPLRGQPGHRHPHRGRRCWLSGPELPWCRLNGYEHPRRRRRHRQLPGPRCHWHRRHWHGQPEHDHLGGARRATDRDRRRWPERCGGRGPGPVRPVPV